MNNRQRSLLFVLVVILGAAACGKTPATNFYTIPLPAAKPASSSAALQLGVDRPRAAHLLRQDRIVYFTSNNELNYYQYHRWAEPPVFLVQSALIRHLQGAGLFDNVVPYRAQKGLDYVLRGRLLAMEEVDGPGGVTARFGLEIELVRQKDNQVVWTGRAGREKSVASKSVDAVVEAMGAAANESLDELAGSLRAAAARLPAAEEAKR